jgi:hypothetical protein
MLGHFDKLSPFDRLRMLGHFDKLSANGMGCCANDDGHAFGAPSNTQPTRSSEVTEADDRFGVLAYEGVGLGHLAA